ncbi:probable E3 ubiquitin-protein ligase HECTD2 [Apostichopus japonicus]|uniref:probable E3 ubiquitin-protein ligase HECTD2 n=1 Tax=Stichopus japonicus TaxID=307972 RepID=UPI003AB212CF
MADGMRSTVALGNNNSQAVSMLPAGPIKTMADPLEELPKRRGLSRQISTSQPKLVTQSKGRESIENILHSQGLRRNSLALAHDLKRNLSASNLAAFSDTNLSIMKAAPVRSYDTPESGSAIAKRRFEQVVKRYFFQMTEGCGNTGCWNSFCKSSPNSLTVSQNMAAIVSIQLSSIQKHYFCSSETFISRALPSTVFQATDCKKRRDFLEALYSTSPFASLFTESSKPKEPSALYETFTKVERAGSKPPIGPIAVSNNKGPSNHRRDLAASRHFEFPRSSNLIRTGSIQDLSSSGDSIMWPEIRPDSGHRRGSSNQSNPDEVMSGRGSRAWSGSSRGDLELTQDSLELDQEDVPLSRSLFRRSTSSSLGGSASGLRSSSRLSFGSGHDRVSSPLLDPNTPPFTPSPVPPHTPRRLLSEQEALEETDDLRAFERSLSMEVAVDGETEFSLTHLTLPMLKSAVEHYAQCGDNSFLLNTIRTVFTSSQSLNLSFKVDDNSALSPLDLPATREAYRLLMGLQPADTFSSVMTNALEILLMNLKRENIKADEISMLFLLMENFLIQQNHDLLLTLSQVLASSLSNGAKNAVIHFLSSYDTDNFLRLLEVFKNCLNSSSKPNQSANSDLLVTVATALSLFYEANTLAEKKRGSPLATIEDFYCNELSLNLDYHEHYKNWQSEDDAGCSNTSEKSILRFPFLLDPITKVRVLHLDAVMQMRKEYQAAIIQQATVDQAMKHLKDNLPATLQENLKAAVCPYLVLEIKRETLIQDALAQIQTKQKDLKKPLKIKFVGGGEQGLDMGGLQKEFFHLIVDSIFDPNRGMFTYSEETRLVWFNGASLELDKEFELVGTLLGLAIYNGVILDVQFPRVLYKNLHNETVSCQDLAEIEPALAKSLQELLNCEDDVEDVFCQTFQISHTSMGETVTIDLKPMGSEIPVTNKNRGEYVDLYVKFLLVDAIQRQFQAFAKGFHSVCGGRALGLFHSVETQLLVCGRKELDFATLEESVTYEDGYHREHKTIKNFWTVVREMTNEQKKQLLHFITGSARVPLRGWSSLPIVIQKNGADSAQLPTAMTCFNRLLLPDYATVERLRQRLFLAVQFSKGFGLT